MNDKINNEITNIDAIELARAIQSKQYSCVEVMEAYLDKIDLLNPHVNAIVSLKPREQLMAEARQKDEQLARGQIMGWMHGFPHAVKDLSATKDIVTTMGYLGLKDNLPEQDSVNVARIRNQGAIIIGKTNTPEFGLGSNTYNQVFGTTFNAYDQAKTSGGSSGGAAVSLALKMLPVADGSDMMGSLRNPAAFNNVYGFRPTQGRVPFGPSAEIFVSQMGYEGPMGRTVADAAKLLVTQSGYDPRMPLSLIDNPDDSAFNPGKRVKPGTRIAWLSNLDGSLPMEPGILDLCEQGLKTFTDLGCIVESAHLGASAEMIWDTWLTLRHWQILGMMKPLYDNPDLKRLLKPEAIWEIEGGLKQNGYQVFNASTQRSQTYQAFVKLFEEYDFVLMPSAQVFPFNAQVHSPMNINGTQMTTYHNYMEVVISVSLAGIPSLNIPVGFGDQGLPMGMQLVGPHAQDFKVLELGHLYEQACGWGQHQPALLKQALK